MNKPQTLGDLIGHPHPESAEANQLRGKDLSMAELIGAPYNNVRTEVSAQTAEVLAKNPCLDAMGAMYRSNRLTDFKRFCRGQNLSWEQVVKAIPNLEEFLDKAAALGAPVPHGITARGELLLVDNWNAINTPEANLDPKRTVRVKLNLPD